MNPSFFLQFFERWLYRITETWNILKREQIAKTVRAVKTIVFLLWHWSNNLFFLKPKSKKKVLDIIPQNRLRPIADIHIPIEVTAPVGIPQKSLMLTRMVENASHGKTYANFQFLQSVDR